MLVLQITPEDIKHSPKHFASACGGKNIEMIKWMIETCNITRSDIKTMKFAPLDAACYIGDLKIVKYLMEKFNLDASIIQNEKFLFTAAQYGKYEIMRYLTGIIIKENRDRKIIYP